MYSQNKLVATMAKTNPIGVRFDSDLLETLKEAGLINSPQKALNLYERSYLQLQGLKIIDNNKSENKKVILAARNTIKIPAKKPLGPEECIPPMPVKRKGEDSLAFGERKSEWKKKYNQ